MILIMIRYSYILYYHIFLLLSLLSFLFVLLIYFCHIVCLSIKTSPPYWIFPLLIFALFIFYCSYTDIYSCWFRYVLNYTFIFPYWCQAYTGLEVVELTRCRWTRTLPASFLPYIFLSNSTLPPLFY